MATSLLLLALLLIGGANGLEECSPPPATQIDLVILLDASHSVGEAGWRQEVDASCTMADRLQTSATTHRIAVVAFHRDAVLLQDWSSDPAQIRSNLQALRYEDVKVTELVTDHPKGIAEATRLLNTTTNSGRRPVAIMVTDGEPYKASSTCRTEAGGTKTEVFTCGAGDPCAGMGCAYDCSCAMLRASEFRDAGHELYVVGVPNQLHTSLSDNFDQVMRGFASQPVERHFFSAPSFDNLASNMVEATEQVCFVAPTETPTKFPTRGPTPIPTAAPTSTIIFVRTGDGATWTLRVDLATLTLGDAMTLIYERTGIARSKQSISHLESGAVLSRQGFPAEEELLLSREGWGIRHRHTLLVEQATVTAPPSVAAPSYTLPPTPRVPLDHAMGATCGAAPHVDVMLVLDASESIGRAGFDEQRTFAARFVRTLLPGTTPSSPQNSNRVGVAAFHRSAHCVFPGCPYALGQGAGLLPAQHAGSSLSVDAARVVGALNALNYSDFAGSNKGTNLPAGLDIAAATLANVPTLPDGLPGDASRRRLVVLFSDGLSEYPFGNECNRGARLDVELGACADVLTHPCYDADYYAPCNPTCRCAQFAASEIFRADVRAEVYVALASQNAWIHMR